MFFSQCFLRLGLAAALLATVSASNAEAKTQDAASNGTGATSDGIEIPAGTILPLSLNHGFSSKNARAGQAVTARVMQDVPLPHGRQLPAGSKVLGTIQSATPAGAGGAGRLSVRFTQVEAHHQRVLITANLRALASFVEVQFAQTPVTAPGFGTPYYWATTELIGGDVKYGAGASVTDSGTQTVGEGTRDGVLVTVRARTGASCQGDPEGQERLQALWVFSSDACGVYGMNGVKIVHAGRTAPVGEIVLAAESGDVKVRGGAGILLRVR